MFRYAETANFLFPGRNGGGGGRQNTLSCFRTNPFIPSRFRPVKAFEIFLHLWKHLSGGGKDFVGVRERTAEMVLLEIGRVLDEAGISEKEALKALDRARQEIYG